jgi:hypothetical protein
VLGQTNRVVGDAIDSLASVSTRSDYHAFCGADLLRHTSLSRDARARGGKEDALILLAGVVMVNQARISARCLAVSFAGVAGGMSKYFSPKVR